MTATFHSHHSTVLFFSYPDLSPVFAPIYSFSMLAILNARISFWRVPSNSERQTEPQMNFVNSRHSSGSSTEGRTTTLPDLENWVGSLQLSEDTGSESPDGRADEEKEDKLGRHTVHDFGQPREVETLYFGSISK